MPSLYTVNGTTWVVRCAGQLMPLSISIRLCDPCPLHADEISRPAGHCDRRAKYTEPGNLSYPQYRDVPEWDRRLSWIVTTWLWLWNINNRSDVCEVLVVLAGVCSRCRSHVYRYDTRRIDQLSQCMGSC